MTLEFIITGFGLGLISSFHCIGMCGPLALALPIHKQSPANKVLGVLLYNLGRVFSYSLLGLLFGFIGRQVYLGGFQQVFSIVLGSIILLYFILSTIQKRSATFRFGMKYYNSIQNLTTRFLSKSALHNLFITGVANGFLPCGMVYLAIAGAAASTNILDGVGFMAAFGFGTLPLMMMLSFAGLFISVPVRSTIRKLTPYVAASVAVLLILRGLNLGIPYLSPHIAPAGSIECH